MDSEPASHVDLSVDIDNLQDPDEFFAAHERRESNLKLSFFLGFFFSWIKLSSL